MPHRLPASAKAQITSPTVVRSKVEISRNKSKIKSKISKKDTVNFGVHLMIDAYYGDKGKLGNMDLVFTILDELPDKLGMHKITTPYVVRANANDKKDTGGYSGFVMIAESHISIHTFPDKGFASVDVYTCQSGLATKRICNYFRESFGFLDLEVRETKRGLRFPKYILN